MTDFPGMPGYKISSKLGEGGVAAVYLGIQENLDRKVAIKVLESNLFNNIETAARFEKEAKTAANLSHSNIIQVFDTGKEDRFYYIVMEYLEESLRERMKREPEGKMPPGSALDIIKNVFKALDYAHIKGIYHRDIKPENIMFKHDSTPVLVDFGIARIFDAPIPETKSGQSLGTTHYMSPEQCRAQKDVDGRSDIYSLGAVFYEMLTGKKPYDGETHISTALKHIEEPVPALHFELSQYQPLIDKMMAKNREDRLSSGPQFLQLLDSILTGKKKKKTRKPLPKKSLALIKKKVLSFLEKVIKKLKSLLKSIKEKLWTLMKKMREKLKSFIHFLVKGKVPSWVLLLVIVAVTLILIFNPNSRNSLLLKPKSQPQHTPEVTQSNISPFLSKLLKGMSEYYQNRLQNLNKLYKGNLNQVNKGFELIDQLKKIKITPGLKDWEKEFTNRRKQLKRDFEEHFSSAKTNFEQKNYAKAKKNVQEAKKINPTKELGMFEEILNKAQKNYKKIQENLVQIKDIQDNQAYSLAASKNTIGAYHKYLAEFPKGRYIKKVNWKINQLKAKTFTKNNELISTKNMQSIIQQHDFFESRYNKSGTFKSDHKKKTLNGVPVIIDQTTDLMWYDEKPLKEMNFKETIIWIESLNNNSYGGYSDWRLPTLEEAASLLRKEANKENPDIDPIFSINPQKIWTKDRFSANSIWVVDLISGQAIMRNKNNKIQVRPVRSME